MNRNATFNEMKRLLEDIPESEKDTKLRRTRHTMHMMSDPEALEVESIIDSEVY